MNACERPTDFQTREESTVVAHMDLQAREEPTISAVAGTRQDVAAATDCPRGVNGCRDLCGAYMDFEAREEPTISAVAGTRQDVAAATDCPRRVNDCRDENELRLES